MIKNEGKQKILILALLLLTFAFTPFVLAQTTPVRASMYVAVICQKIRPHWHPPAGYTGQPLVLSYRVFRNGAISNVQCKSYNDPNYLNWQAAMDAFKMSAPLPRPDSDFFLPNRNYSDVSIDFSAFYYQRDRATKEREAPLMFPKMGK